ncbi:MAG TPA: helix-turn-helix domain-containing protein [Mycobacterium sp.]|nr:helix-turn-helix domain-containing protein [Mycobacterium sp.]
MSAISKAAREPGGRRRDVLQVLKTSTAPMSIAPIAEQLDVHPNTVRFHLDTLVDAGLVERVTPDRRGPGRPPLLYRAVRQMDRDGSRRYRLLAEILAMGFAADKDRAAKARAAGRAWARRLGRPTATAHRAEESIDRLVGLLDELGFAPERGTSGDTLQVGLRHCPFLELAETRADVICPIHQGLMQGALETWGAPIAVERLDAFAEPDLCLAHLTAAEART